MSALAGFRVLAGTAFVLCTAGLFMNDMRWAAAGLLLAGVHGALAGPAHPLPQPDPTVGPAHPAFLPFR
jgi:hypothetical protein